MPTHEAREAAAKMAGRNLEALLKESVESFKRMSPEEQRAVIEAQRESWVRAFGPESACGHGWRDFEECPQCRASSTHGARKIARGLSPAMQSVLTSERGFYACSTATWLALRKRGLVNQGAFTDLGRAVAAALREGGDTA